MRGNKIRRAIKDVFDNSQGHYLLKCLKEDYVDVSALSTDPQATAYKLGQKELVQGLIAELNKDNEIDAIKTTEFDI